MGRGTQRRRASLAVAPGLGQRIREQRARLGLTQAQLGDPVYRGGYISNIEHGRASPSLEALSHIATRLGLTPADLVGGELTVLRPTDALARASELLAQAAGTASVVDREIVDAAALVLDALRRRLDA